ncbi:Replicative DNA helicase [Nitrospira defluvii]|jgi:replicative DNA helicase|uniref:Replicative DNA helicase n=1 Tax=Nitrospira defluvii TaxID=330214 RepID=D8P8R4_9BACT|nr:Replicative DNA helicase [Nitrospira defluvii]
MTMTTIEHPTMPPHDLDAERAILGAILLCPAVLATVGELVQETDFYDSHHQGIFSAMCRLENAGGAIDHIVVAEELKRRGLLEKVGGSAAVAELIETVATAANVTTHCRVVQEKARRRAVRQMAFDLFTRSTDEQETLDALIDQAEQTIFGGQDLGQASSRITTAQLVNERLHHLETLYKSRRPFTGISTGFATLDRLTAGLQPGTLNIIAARPSMGKTALALSIAAHVALETNLPVQIFSLEMSKEELIDRLFALTAQIDLHAIRTGKVSSADWFDLATSADQLSNAPLFIEDSGSITMAQLRRRARRAKAKTGLALMIVDYLQLMTPSLRGESRQQEISDMSRALKLLAKELGVPIIALSQLNRKVEERGDKRPMLSDLRESGSIEQDADLVAFIYRDEVYNPDSLDKGLAEILVRKHRSGPVGEQKLLFREQYAKFEDLPAD